MTIVGQTGFVEHTGIPVWRKDFGWTIEYTVEGTKEQVDPVATQWAGVSGVIEVRYAQRKPFWSVTIAFAGRSIQEATNPPNPDSLVEVSWGFPRNELQRDIWTHPTIEEQLANMSMLYRGRFRADVEAWINGQTVVEVQDESGQTSELALSLETLVQAAVASGASDAVIRQFLGDLALGVQFYKSSQRVLRITRTGPTQGQWLVANSNTNQVHTRDRIIRDFGPPAWVQAKMPQGYWFKNEPEEDQVGAKLQMTQEFEFFGSRYSAFAYGAPNT